MNWQQQIETELEKAGQARSQGKEGQARVCARRAAGIAIREYYSRKGFALQSTSALDLLNQLRVDKHRSQQLTPLIDHLMLRVGKDFELPTGIDLVKEARLFCAKLLPD